MRNFFFVVISNIIISAVVNAQGTTVSSIQDTMQLDEIVVTGSKIEVQKKKVPFSVSQIHRRQIENTGVLNILSMLNTYVPGVFVTERNILGFGVAQGGAGGINIRGLGSAPNTGVLLLIDGHPQYQGIFGHPLADAYVASDVEKVEVIRGPASVLYGTNAMGGVVNILTRRNDKPGATGSFGASYGSYNTQKYFGNVGYRKDKLDVFASLNHDKTDGVRDSTDFKITNGYIKTAYRVNDRITATADVMLAKFVANDMGPVYKPAYFGINILRGKTSFTILNKLEKVEGALKLYHNFGNHHLSDGFQSTDRNTGGMFYQTFQLFRGNSITAGTDIRQYGGRANRGKAKDTIKMVNEIAAYVYTQQTFANVITLSGGLRLEHNDRWGKQWAPVAGITVSPTTSTTLKASLSKGFRSPTIMEMYLYAPNPLLKPERMMNYELSGMQSLFNGKITMEITTYVANGENLIQVSGYGPTAKRENTGTFNNKGIEAVVNYRPASRLHVHSNYSYLYQKRITIAAPRHQYNINVNYQYRIWDFFTGLQYIGQLYSNPALVTPHSYTLLNARISAKPYRKVNIFIAGNNLLNSEYEINDGYPMPKANFSTGVSIIF